MSYDIELYQFNCWSSKLIQIHCGCFGKKSYNILVPFSDDSSPSAVVATFKVDVAALYKVMCDTLKEDQVTLFLYLLLHRNPHFKAFVLSRTNIDQLVS